MKNPKQPENGGGNTSGVPAPKKRRDWSLVVAAFVVIGAIVALILH